MGYLQICLDMKQNGFTHLDYIHFKYLDSGNTLVFGHDQKIKHCGVSVSLFCINISYSKGRKESLHSIIKDLHLVVQADSCPD